MPLERDLKRLGRVHGRADPGPYDLMRCVTSGPAGEVCVDRPEAHLAARGDASSSAGPTACGRGLASWAVRGRMDPPGGLADQAVSEP